MLIGERNMAALIDTSLLFAAMFVKDVNHAKARTALQTLNETRVVPAPVVYELFYMTTVRINYERAITAFESLQASPYNIEALTPLDMRRMVEIMRQYRDAQLDLADVALMTIAERLNITRVYTFDRRDFSIFRPRHCDYLELLP